MRKLKSFKIFTCLCLVLTFSILISIGILTKFRNDANALFTNMDTEEQTINIYTLVENTDPFETSDDLTFIIQTTIDQENQNLALDEIKSKFNKELNIIKKVELLDAVDALYEKEGKFLVLNAAYANTLDDLSAYQDFTSKTKIVYSFSRSISQQQTYNHQDITNTPFTIYVAGDDTRGSQLTTFGRTDVNLLLNVNPNTKQILIVGIPRDAYIPNPALNYEDDKLTHLGNEGIQNTMNGISEYFNIDINYYGKVIFDSFEKIIDAIGGIDVDNPYYFDTIDGNGKLDGGVDHQFPEGLIHLDGESALAYCRERYNLSNGDYGRNEHQTYVLKAVVKKVLSKDILTNYASILSALEGQFMTNLTTDEVLKLVSMQLTSLNDWEIINYHLGGTGDMCGTASMGWNRQLYVVHLFDSQVQFIHDQIEKLKNDEILVQDILPQNDETTYIPN